MSHAGGPAGEADEQQRTTTKVVLISIVAAIGGFLFGFDTAVINGAVKAVTEEFRLGDFLSGFAVSCALLGAAVGAWFAGRLADRYGRKAVMIVGGGLFAISAVGSAFAFGVVDLILWRVVGGVGVGVASVIAPTYIAEVAPAHIRGRLASLQQLAITVGIFVALLSDAFIANTAGGASEEAWLGWDAWRWMFLAGVVPSVVWAFLALQVPESPRYLIAQGQTQKATDVLREVLGTKSLDALQRKVADIKQSMRREHDPSLRDLLGHRFGLLPIVWVGILLSVFQQAVGINVIFYYSTVLWQAVGFEESQAFTTSVITSVTNVVVTFIAIATVDRIGRKPLLLVGSAAMAVSLAVMAVSFAQATGGVENPSLPAPWGVIAVVAANAYVVAFGATWGPVVWVLLGEMFPNKIRAAALAVAASAQWLANFAISTSFPSLASAGLQFAYGLYATFAALSFVFVWRAVRETKGRELEDMGADTDVRDAKVDRRR
ncbi:sugar porter family MFS transporter [Kineococcus sp. R8]|uniref:sugar porter family MFS transporter n=1 Tax=Kineococcus siccus TaxID=2696567 RepID=UPI001413485B|nr:sugar porter family MFS transporter [Kineococcus siccus]NAZ80822.1 sugar porter family MFS transporter [Kineococcus siccus]